MATTSALRSMLDQHTLNTDPPAGWTADEAAVEILKTAIEGVFGTGAVTPHVTFLGATASQIIPSGAIGWSYVILTGTATVAGVALIPAGVGDSDGHTLAATLTITTAAASSAYVRWNT